MSKQRDKNLASSIRELESLCDKLYIPQSVKEKAISIYSSALDKGLLRRSSSVKLTYAALYAACRHMDFPRFISEIAEAGPLSREELQRNYRLLVREGLVEPKAQDPLLYIPRIAEKLGISMKAQELAIRYLKKAKEKHILPGKSPLALAAGALYLACIECGEKKLQRDIAKAACVSEVSIRNSYKYLMKKLDWSLPW